MPRKNLGTDIAAQAAMQWGPTYSSTSPTPGGGPSTPANLPSPEEGEKSLFTQGVQGQHPGRHGGQAGKPAQLCPALLRMECKDNNLVVMGDKLATLPSPKEGEKYPLAEKA